MFIHYLITRFNIKIENYGPEYMSSPDMDIDWLTKRLRLFLKYCVPSVLEQNNTQFTWLIYLDPGTPQSILDQIEFLRHGVVKTEFHFAADYTTMLEDIVFKIKNTSSRFVMTSRLDNDDMINRSFIRDAQNSFRPKHSTIINFNAGYEYSFLECVLKKWNTRLNNPFISLIEEGSAPDILSIYGFPHWKPPVTCEIINITGRPNWIYLHHNQNYSGTRLKGIPLFVKPKGLSMFPASAREIHISFTQTLNHAIRWLPVVLFRRLKSLTKSFI